MLFRSVGGNVLYPAALHKRVYRSLLNRYLRSHANPENHIAYFGRLEKYVQQRPSFPGEAIELMTHPGMDKDWEFLNSPDYAAFLMSVTLMR